MSRSAQVRSLDALQRMAAAVRVFAEDTSVALDDLRMDLHRILQWIEYDQKDYWTQELRRAEQALTEARLNLERARMFRFGDSQPSCYAEKKAVEAAQRRIEVARHKLEAVKRWGRIMEHEATECRSAVAPLAHWVQTDAPRAVALLRRLSGALESYVDLEITEQSEQSDDNTAAAPSGEEAEGNRMEKCEGPDRNAPPAQGERNTANDSEKTER